MTRQSASPIKAYRTVVNQLDPCPPTPVKTYQTPPNLYLGFQPPGLPQFSPIEALARGTLWPIFYNPYYNRREAAAHEGCS